MHLTIVVPGTVVVWLSQKSTPQQIEVLHFAMTYFITIRNLRQIPLEVPTVY